MGLPGFAPGSPTFSGNSLSLTKPPEAGRLTKLPHSPCYFLAWPKFLLFFEIKKLNVKKSLCVFGTLQSSKNFEAQSNDIPEIS